jgi:resuscitation-promoting factor RpfB
MRLPGIVALAFLALAAPIPSFGVGTTPADARSPATTCGAGSYINSRGNCVHRPMRANRAPAGATAKCRDGTYSFSQSRRGTCSWHGGVAQWL